MTATLYVSGWCGSTRHDRCLGAYAGTGCTCECHARPELVTVRCFFGCPHVVQDIDPHAAHDAMEAHYFDTHREQIRDAIGWCAAEIAAKEATA